MRWTVRRMRAGGAVLLALLVGCGQQAPDESTAVEEAAAQRAGAQRAAAEEATAESLAQARAEAKAAAKASAVELAATQRALAARERATAERATAERATAESAAPPPAARPECTSPPSEGAGPSERSPTFDVTGEGHAKGVEIEVGLGDPIVESRGEGGLSVAFLWAESPCGLWVRQNNRDSLIFGDGKALPPDYALATLDKKAGAVPTTGGSRVYSVSIMEYPFTITALEGGRYRVRLVEAIPVYEGE